MPLSFFKHAAINLVLKFCMARVAAGTPNSSLSVCVISDVFSFYIECYCTALLWS